MPPLGGIPMRTGLNLRSLVIAAGLMGVELDRDLYEAVKLFAPFMLEAHLKEIKRAQDRVTTNG